MAGAGVSAEPLDFIRFIGAMVSVVKANDFHWDVS
jgi:hypothetical protein